MILFFEEQIHKVCDDTIIMLDTDNSMPKLASMVYVYIQHSLDFFPCTRIVCGTEADLVSRIVLCTLDDGLPLKANDTSGLIGVGALGHHRSNPRCKGSEEVTASIIHNLIQLGHWRTQDVVHVDACSYAIADADCFVIVVNRVFNGEHYYPEVTLYNKGEVLFTGDPGQIIMYKD